MAVIKYPRKLPPAPDRTQPGQDYPVVAKTWAGELTEYSAEQEEFADSVVGASSTSNFSATSTTPLTLATGFHDLTIDAGKQFIVGTDTKISDINAPDVNYMYGIATAYNFSTGAMTFKCKRKFGVGTYSAWSVVLAGEQGIGGDTLPDFTGNIGKFLTPNEDEDGTEWQSFLPNTALLGTLTAAAEAEFIFSGDWSNYENLTLEFDGTFNPGGTSKAFTIYAASAAGAWSAGQALITTASSQVLKALAKFFHVNANGGFWDSSINFSGSGDSVALTSSANLRGWRIAGGIGKLRLLCEAGSSFTGTIKLYGDKINGQV